MSDPSSALVRRTPKLKSALMLRGRGRAPTWCWVEPDTPFSSDIVSALLVRPSSISLRPIAALTQVCAVSSSLSSKTLPRSPRPSPRRPTSSSRPTHPPVHPPRPRPSRSSTAPLSSRGSLTSTLSPLTGSATALPPASGCARSGTRSGGTRRRRQRGSHPCEAMSKARVR